MPKRSRHISHGLMIISGTFALLLIVAGIYAPRLKPFPDPRPKIEKNQTLDQTGTIEEASTKESAPADALIDTSTWKKYADPVYHFTIRYPSEWATPVAKKISDPDFDYEYQISFGTAETMAGQNFEGFTIFIFRTEKCNVSANQVNNQSNAGSVSPCSTKKSTVSTGTTNPEKILEFSSMAYTYTIVPFIHPDNVDPNLEKKVNLNLDEAGKTFQYDSTLKIIVSPKPASAAPPPKPAAPIGRRGKLTGAVASGGRLVCPHPNRKPTRSPNQGNHVDEDCCPDPDEYPNVACAYKPGDYRIMLKPK
jgi:hypothetical protein